MINYPSGFKKEKNKKLTSYKNRGLRFEDEINQTNKYYLDKDLALIYKKPTPIHVVKYSSKNNRISDAYYEVKSTTDYNGIYRGKYIDFDAKSTLLKTSFPLDNIKSFQLEHLKKVVLHGGIGFIFINFKTIDEYYILTIQKILDYTENNSRKSIPYSFIKENGIKVERKLNPPLDYLSALDSLVE